jgi:phosphatidylserine/phosphatidylglycerophosphate/cardiolipin synthase-like enzyme
MKKQKPKIYKGTFTKSWLIILSNLLTFYTCNKCKQEHGNAKLADADIEIFHSPNGGCTEKIVKCIDSTESEILILTFSFTSKEILEALKRAHARGVKISVVMDSNQAFANGSLFSELRGIANVVRNRRSDLQHNKIMIFDKESMVTGSFNFTRNAEVNNLENMLYISNKEIVNNYLRRWDEIIEDYTTEFSDSYIKQKLDSSAKKAKKTGEKSVLKIKHKKSA